MERFAIDHISSCKAVRASDRGVDRNVLEMVELAVVGRDTRLDVFRKSVVSHSISERELHNRINDVHPGRWNEVPRQTLLYELPQFARLILCKPFRLATLIAIGIVLPFSLSALGNSFDRRALATLDGPRRNGRGVPGRL